jgi:serine/threonine-protein kinase
MVCTRGGIPDQIKVLDFGLVKEQSTDTGLSFSGMLVGTPSYLPPEAIRDPGKVDPRSDLYAVGAVGYYLLSGTPVFEGRTVVEVCAKHLESKPDPISKRTSALIPEALEHLVQRCLAKEPSERYASAAELVQTLEALPFDASWSTADAEQWWKEHGSNVRSAAQTARDQNATPGPLTLAVDPDRKALAATALP